jgi:hypothetical protein
MAKKTKKNIKVQDLKPKKDAKGGGGHYLGGGHFQGGGKFQGGHSGYQGGGAGRN